MKDEFNNLNSENLEANKTLEVPNKQPKFISTRKRKELINTESDNEENTKNNEDQNIKIQNEESKENENNEYFHKSIKKKYEFNKYNTIEKSQNDNSTVKTNTALQEKLKKIFMNRDKVKFQYEKQDIPDNLKYHSDESETSENEELRKSKPSRKKTPIISGTKKDKDIVYSKQRESIRSSNKRKISELKLSNSRNKNKKSDNEGNEPSEFDNYEKVMSVTKDEGMNYNNSNNKRKISNNNNEEEKIKSSNKNSGTKYERVRGKFKYNNTNSNAKSNKKNSDENMKETEGEEHNKKDKIKKNILLKVLQKFEKKEENSEKENNDLISNQNNLNDEEEKEKLDKKQKLLKLLIRKKNSNDIEEDENNINQEQEKEISPNEEIDQKKEDRRRKIIEEIQCLSNNKNQEKEEQSGKREESFKEEKEEENNDKDRDDDDNDKGTYIPAEHKNRLTISIKPKSKLIKQISSSSLEEKPEEKEKEKEEIEEKPKNNKTNALINILKKLNKKKTEEKLLEENNKDDNNNPNDINIDESEIEKEAEKIRKKEKKMQERKLAKENQRSKYKSDFERDLEDDSNALTHQSYNKQNYEENNNIKEKDKKKEEILKRNQLKEDLRMEMNELNKEDESTVNNSSKSNLINSTTTQLTNLENEDKSKQKESNFRPTHQKNISTRNNFVIDQGAAPNEIIVNDMPKSNLDRSFDNSNNTYVKRRIPSGRNPKNVYKPRKVEMRGRSQEKVINDYYDNTPGNMGLGQNNNQNFLRYKNVGNNRVNRNAYIRKKTATQENNNFVANNHSFCEYQIDNDDNMNMDLDVGGGLNSSFDAYMQMQMNHNNNFENNFMNRNKNNNIFFDTAAKNFNNNRKINRNVRPPSNNVNFMRGYSNNIRQDGNNFNNDEINRSYGYIKNNIYNDNNKYFNNEPNYNNNYNINYNQQTNYIGNTNNNFFKQNQSQNIPYNNYNQNSYYYNNSPKQYIPPSSPNINTSNFNNNYYPNSPTNFQRYTPNKNKEFYSNNTPRKPKNERNTSINIEDLMVLEEKFNEINIALNKSHCMHNECFEFWNYYYNCSLYGKLETLFKTEEDQNNVQLSINHLLISVMICYDFSFEIQILNNEYSILIDILTLNHRNLIIIFEHILSKISSESMYNPWVFKLKQMVNSFKKMDDGNYISNDGRLLNSVEKILYNLSIIVQNIRVLLKNYKTHRIEYLTSIFKKIGEKSYEEINSFFRDNILRVDNVRGSVLASVFLKENQYFKTEPAPYIKTKNRKPYSLILDLDETLVHFKVNSDDDSEGVLQIRPGVIPFLELVSKFYELIIFTAATQDYGDLLIDAIEENNVYFEHRFYRQHTVIMGNDFIKDLTRVGRPLDKIIIVDNMPQNFRLQKENGINIKAFWGEDVNDNALEELGKILVNIAKDGGDVRIGLEKYRDEIVKKVTSNISRNNY
jgi:Dullard-like phosphatase family protein